MTQIGSSGSTGVLGNSASRSTGSNSGSGSAGLATTGSTVRPLIALATILIAVGTLFALGARRRNE